MASDAHDKLGLRWRDLGHEVVSGIKDKYHGTKNNVEHVKDEARHVVTNVVDKGFGTKNELVSNVKDGVEKGKHKLLETSENAKEWSAKTGHVVNEGLKERLEGARDTIVNGIEGAKQKGIENGNVAKEFIDQQGVALKRKVPSVVNTLEHTMKDIEDNIHKQGAITSQKMTKNYATTMNSTPKGGHGVVDKVADTHMYVEGKVVETYQDGKHKAQGLGHSMLLEGKIGRKVDALAENDKRLNAKIEQTMIETYEGVIGKATELGQNVLGIVGDTYRDAKAKEKELERKQFQRYEQAYEKGGEYVDKAKGKAYEGYEKGGEYVDKMKGKAYEGYEKGSKFGHNIGDKILNKYEEGVDTTQGYVHDVKNNLHGAKESIEAKFRHGQNNYEDDNTMSRQDFASKSKQITHNVKMKTLKGIRDQASKISNRAQDYYDQEVDDERDDYYRNQYGNAQEVDHVAFLESLGGAKGTGLLDKFNQMTEGIRDRTKEHELKAQKVTEKGVEVAKNTTEEGGKKAQEIYQKVNDKVVESGRKVANVETEGIRDRTKEHEQTTKNSTKKGVEVAKHVAEEGGKKAQEIYQKVNDKMVESGRGVANVVRDMTSQTQEGAKIVKDEIKNDVNNVVDSMKGIGQNLIFSMKETNENLMGASTQENLYKPTTTSFEDHGHLNDEPLALGTKTNKDSIETLHSLSQPKHAESVIHLSQSQVHLKDPIVDGKLEGPPTDSTTIVELGPVVVSGKAHASNPNNLITFPICTKRSRCSFLGYISF